MLMLPMQQQKNGNQMGISKKKKNLNYSLI
jgi:hypothetical protein